MGAHKYTKGEPEYIEGFGWEADLTKENCTPQAWEALGGDTEIDKEGFEKFFKEFLNEPGNKDL